MPEPAPTCPWCAAPVAEGTQTCPACGAAIAQRESIGDLKIPGLTSVDPALEDFDKRPLHLRGPSPTQGAAPALIIAAAAGGPIGALAIGGVAALAATEYLGASRGGTDALALEDVGKPSEVVLQALERAEAGDAPGPTHPDAAAPDEPDPAAADGGMFVWRDLPPSPGGD